MDAGEFELGMAGVITRLEALMDFRKWMVLFPCAIVAFASHVAWGQSGSFPDRPIKLIVSFPPGSSSDLIARQIGAEMSKDLGQPIVVDNRAGSQTIVGMQSSLQSPPDGYTMVLFGSTPAAINVTMFKKLPYDPVRDFTPIGLIGEAPLIMVASPKLAANTASELVRFAKENPGKLNCGYGSTATQVGCEAFASLAGIKLVSVAYKGTPQALIDLVSGTIDVTFFDYPFAVPQIKSGKVKSYGVTSKERFALAPDMPTVADAVQNFDLKVFFGLAAPARSRGCKSANRSTTACSARSARRSRRIRCCCSAINASPTTATSRSAGASVHSK